MPKRQNPFGDSSPLQFKNKISIKEVNLGVCGKEKMQSVYERTKAKMFEGARRKVVPGLVIVTNECSREPLEGIVPLPGQRRLDAGGNLQPLPYHSGQEIRTTPIVKLCSFQGVSQLPTQCHMCNRISGDTLSGCFFCEKRACPNCMHTCHQCQQKYCNICSVLNYDDLTERVFCLQCSPP